ncbi:MAG: glycosyltransferase [Acidobacteriota bacterium]|nr:glycosyltransferase [Acidobacteriota bacterium]
MIIAQLVLPGASEYERKSQRIDFAALSAEHDVRIGTVTGVDIVHIYAPRDLDPATVRDLTVPFVCNARAKTQRFAWRKITQPARVIFPLKETAETFIPEAVEDSYFEPSAIQQTGNRATVGTYARRSIRNLVEQTATRIHRFRDDVDWLLFDSAPSIADLRGVDVWVDPAATDDDFDGFVAEALVAGNAVIATRTAINAQRLEKGRTGILVPTGDPNELTHAILAALFKPELRHTRIAAAQQTASKFRPRHRARALNQLYESILQ